ncbi:MAG: citrate synthase [Spirochaetes bacterium]|nr:citrate synthase [Spirochaetota bacterium]
MPEIARLILDGKTYELPVLTGTEGEKAVDIRRLREESGYITLDDGYGNTGSCQSAITFIDGDQGILRYRGYDIQELAEHSTFIETAWLLIYGELPTVEQAEGFSALLTEQAMLHTDTLHHFEGFPEHAPPMAILSAMLNVMACQHPELLKIENEAQLLMGSAKIISKVRTIAAFAYRKSKGLPFNDPHPDYKYCGNFLHMMFSIPYHHYEVHPDIERALNLFMILHADHEQNCSTSTVRIVGSARTNLFTSVSAGVCALWGPLHGGANVEVVQMLDEIVKTGKNPREFIERAKDKSSGFKLSGFGHRVYKNFDPRARILKASVEKVLKIVGIRDKSLEVAMQMEDLALKDPYFIERKLYPNVDFYSGILLRAIGIPADMFTVMFAIGRTPGWISNWKELLDQGGRINRPRQIYTGKTLRPYVGREDR